MVTGETGMVEKPHHQQFYDDYNLANSPLFESCNLNCHREPVHI